MTTSDPTTGRFAATRRSRGAALVCACVFAGVALPTFAMQPVAPATGAAALPAASGAAGVAGPASAPVATRSSTAGTTRLPPVAASAGTEPRDAVVVVMDEPLQMSDRALLLANDINRLIARPSAPAASERAEDTTGAGSRIQNVLQRALTLLGTPYRWGGTTTAGFDCSGLVGYVFRTTLGIELPRVSRDMARSGEEVDRASLVPGDLVFFGRKGRVDHVGIYLGDGRFVHAPRTGRDVTVSNLDGYWGRKFLEARRVAGI